MQNRAGADIFPSHREEVGAKLGNLVGPGRRDCAFGAMESPGCSDSEPIASVVHTGIYEITSLRYHQSVRLQFGY